MRGKVSLEVEFTPSCPFAPKPQQANPRTQSFSTTPHVVSIPAVSVKKPAEVKEDNDRRYVVASKILAPLKARQPALAYMEYTQLSKKKVVKCLYPHRSQPLEQQKI